MVANLKIKLFLLTCLLFRNQDGISSEVCKLRLIPALVSSISRDSYTDNIREIEKITLEVLRSDRNTIEYIGRWTTLEIICDTEPVSVFDQFFTRDTSMRFIGTLYTGNYRIRFNEGKVRDIFSFKHRGVRTDCDPIYKNAVLDSLYYHNWLMDPLAYTNSILLDTISYCSEGNGLLAIQIDSNYFEYFCLVTGKFIERSFETTFNFDNGIIDDLLPTDSSIVYSIQYSNGVPIQIGYKKGKLKYGLQYNFNEFGDLISVFDHVNGKKIRLKRLCKVNRCISTGLTEIALLNEYLPSNTCLLMFDDGRTSPLHQFEK